MVTTEEKNMSYLERKWKRKNIFAAYMKYCQHMVVLLF
jgi:hypothetical protein